MPLLRGEYVCPRRVAVTMIISSGLLLGQVKPYKVLAEEHSVVSLLLLFFLLGGNKLILVIDCFKDMLLKILVLLS